MVTLLPYISAGLLDPLMPHRLFLIIIMDRRFLTHCGTGRFGVCRGLVLEEEEDEGEKVEEVV